MITLAGTALPESAVWENETSHGNLKAEITRCPDGTLLLRNGDTENRITLYFPRISGELTGETVKRVKELQTQGSIMNLTVNGKSMDAVFHPEKPLELNPVSRKQTQTDTDSYWGRINLLEV